VNHVTGGAELVGEGVKPFRLPLRVVEQQDLGHDAHPIRPDGASG